MPKAKPTSAGTTDAEPAYAGTTDQNETGKAVVTHVLGLLTLFIGPLVMYFLFRGKASPWLREHLNEAVNYHILLVAAFILVVVALAFLSQVTIAVTVLAIVLLLLVLVHVVFSLAAIVQAARGRSFHFPLDVRMVK